MERGELWRVDLNPVCALHPAPYDLRPVKVRLPQIEVDELTRLGDGAEQLGGREAHAVERLRLLALAVRVRVWEDVRAVIVVDDAVLAARSEERRVGKECRSR